jgi:large subunit ribosomal protein L21
MYAIVKTGGKQYRVEEGQSLLVERLPVDDGGKAVLQPLLYVDGSNVVDGDELAKVSIEARVVGHERGPKLRVVKFKPKRGYKRRTGHRQELTRIEVTSIKLGSRRAAGSGSAASRSAPKPVAAEEAPAAVEAKAEAGAPAVEKPTRSRTRKPPAAEGEAEAKPTTAEGETEPKSTTPQGEAEAKPARPRRSPAKPKEDNNGA